MFRVTLDRFESTNLLDNVQQLGQLKGVAHGGVQLKSLVHLHYFHVDIAD